MVRAAGDGTETEAAAKGPRVGPALAAVTDFATSSLVAIASFLVIYTAALLLGVLIQALNGLFRAAAWLAGVGEFVEHVLVYADVTLLIVFLIFEIARYVRGRLREWNG